MVLRQYRLSPPHRTARRGVRYVAGFVADPSRRAIQHGHALRRTAAHQQYPAQRRLLFFPSGLHRLPGRHDTAPRTGTAAHAGQADRSGSGITTVHDRQPHRTTAKYPSRDSGYASVAGLPADLPEKTENPPESTLQSHHARQRQAVHGSRPEQNPDQPEQTGHIPLGKPQRHASRFAARTRYARCGNSRRFRLSAGGGTGNERHLEIEQPPRAGTLPAHKQQQSVPGRGSALAPTERFVRMADRKPEFGRDESLAAQLLRIRAQRIAGVP